MQHLMPRALRTYHDPDLDREWRRLADQLYDLLEVGQSPHPVELRLTTSADQTFYLTARAATMLSPVSTVRALRCLLAMIATTAELNAEVGAIVAHALQLTRDYDESSALLASTQFTSTTEDVLRGLLDWLTFPPDGEHE